MKTYLLNYLKPNTFTFYDLIPSKEEIDANELVAKELDPEKKKKIISQEDSKRFIQMRVDVRLVPGINEISEETYSLMRAHKTNGKSTLDFHLDSRPPSMSWISGFSPEDEKMKTFSSLKDREALDIVEAMWEKPLIEKYLANEKRETIKKALEAQLDKLIIKPRKAA